MKLKCWLNHSDSRDRDWGTNYPMLPLVWMVVSAVIGVLVARTVFDDWVLVILLGFGLAVVLDIFGFVMFALFVQVYDWAKGRRKKRR